MREYCVLAYPQAHYITLEELMLRADKYKNLSIQTLQYIVGKVYLALLGLKVRGFSHLDVHERNIVLTDALQVSLTNFGFSACNSEKHTHCTSTVDYMPPEVL